MIILDIKNNINYSFLIIYFLPG